MHVKSVEFYYCFGEIRQNRVRAVLFPILYFGRGGVNHDDEPNRHCSEPTRYDMSLEVDRRRKMCIHIYMLVIRV